MRKPIPLGFQQFIGKKLLHVVEEIKHECHLKRYSLNVEEVNFNFNVDVEKDRLNVIVSDAGIVTEIYLG